MRKNKYRQGSVIRTIGELLCEIEAGRYVYLNHKPQNPGWVISMQLRAVLLFLNSGRIRKAEAND